MNCIRYASSLRGSSFFNYDIPSENCGSEMETIGDTVELSNVLIFQNDADIQEIWDFARRITCNWVERQSKKVTFDPFAVGMLSAEELVFEGENDIDCWMDIQLGGYPHTSDINSIVRIGDTLSLLVFVRDNNEMYDVSVKDCYAYGGFDLTNSPKIQLTDNNGCVVKEKLISEFTTVREDDSSGSILVTYAHVKAFKFPDVMDVHMNCNIDICKGECDNKCVASTTKAPFRTGSTLFGEPIFTEAPEKCPPGSTNPECLPPVPPTVPTCYPGSLDPKCIHEPDCLSNPSDPRCDSSSEILTTLPTTISPPKCQPDSTDPRCPIRCYPGSTDPRCPTVPPTITTVAPTITTARCYPGSRDPRCPTLPPTTHPPKCFPGSTDARCPTIIRSSSTKCFPGSTDPQCLITESLKCLPNSIDPRCLPETMPPETNCRPGSKNLNCRSVATPVPKCPSGSKNPDCSQDTERPKCYPGSKDPSCSATKPPRSGSSLFPGSQTLPKTTTIDSPWHGKSTKHPPSSSESTPTKSGKNLIKNEPKPEPEPSNGEWVGNPRYHAFHSYHYDKGDGRRARKNRNKSHFRLRVKRNIYNEKTAKIKKLKMEGAFLVAPLTENRRIRRDSNKWSTAQFDHVNSLDMDKVCLSIHILTFGLSILISFLFITTTMAVILFIRQRRISRK